VGDDVVAKWVSNEKDKAALDTQKRCKFRPEMRQNAFGGHPLGELDRSPNPLARSSVGRVPTSKGEGREGNGKRRGRGGKGEGRKGRGGREREGRTLMPY